jgi:uncharacterized protein YndB with AHSA1/START domain
LGIIPECRSASSRNRVHLAPDSPALEESPRGRRPLVNYLYEQRKLDPWWSTTVAVEYERSRGQLEKDGLVRGYSICATKTIAAPPDMVYAAFVAGIDWLRSASEGDSFDDCDGHTGTIKKLAPGKTIRFTWAGNGHSPAEKVEVKLTPSGAKTTIMVNHERLPDRPAADGVRAAWGKVLDGVKERLA